MLGVIISRILPLQGRLSVSHTQTYTHTITPLGHKRAFRKASTVPVVDQLLFQNQDFIPQSKLVANASLVRKLHYFLKEVFPCFPGRRETALTDHTHTKHTSTLPVKGTSANRNGSFTNKQHHSSRNTCRQDNA